MMAGKEQALRANEGRAPSPVESGEAFGEHLDHLGRIKTYDEHFQPFQLALDFGDGPGALLPCCRFAGRSFRAQFAGRRLIQIAQRLEQFVNANRVVETPQQIAVG